MNLNNAPPSDFSRDPDRLLKIIKVQSEIAKQGHDLSAVISLVARHAQQLTNATGAVMELVDGEDMVYRATSGFAESLLGLRLKRKGSLSGLCIEEGRPLRCIDSETDDRVDRNACRRVGLRSMIVEPLRHNGVPVGVIKVISPVPDAFNELDMKTLELLAESIAAAMFFAVKYESSELFQLATHDSLTGLANRACFYDRFRLRLKQAQENHESFAIYSFDMDGLKAINDYLGHRIGDIAIKEFSTRLLANTTKDDTVARMGGDEFSIIWSRSATHESATDHACEVAQKIAVPFQWGDTALPIGGSIGFALFPKDGAEIEELLETADKRMYQEKRRKKEDILRKKPGF